MKKFTIQIIFLLLVIGISLVLFSPTSGNRNIKLPFLPEQKKSADLEINSAVIKVEVADTASKRSKGLGGRQTLGENEGMLFIFDRADKYVFWMKGLSFPLDFVWIKDTKVLDIVENISPQTQGQDDASLPVYSSNEPVDKVLELNAGTVKRLNIKVGDTIKITI